MRFSNSHLAEKSHHKHRSQRERWVWSGPLLCSFLGISAIVSFFFFSLRSPNPSLLLRPNLPALQSIHDPTPPKEKQRCNLFKGHWIKQAGGAGIYTNWSCPTIPESKNCFKQGRKDMDFVNWRWKPDECELPRFDSMAFLHLLRGKKLAFIGDSVARNQFESLLCFLSQVEIPQDVYKDSEDRFRTWYFPKSDLTLLMLWTKFLVAGEERVVNGTGTGVFDLQFNEIDKSWTQHLPEIDYAILSNGHWFFRVLYLHERNNIPNCIYCSDSNITSHNPDFALRMAFRAAFKYINECKNCGKLVTFVRTFSPAHFENGVWNTGGYCNRTGPSSAKVIDQESFDWKLRNIQIEETDKARLDGRGKGKRFEVIDVTMAMTMRADGHPGEFWGNKWMKGYNDCVHWCMPGPIDAWNELLMAVIRKEEAAMDS
ncbi:Protein ALTERED XYLOGLUCAN 4-like protein, partial [Cucurbita argyrosperma subsp. sororia]